MNLILYIDESLNVLEASSSAKSYFKINKLRLPLQQYFKVCTLSGDELKTLPKSDLELSVVFSGEEHRGSFYLLPIDLKGEIVGLLVVDMVPSAVLKENTERLISLGTVAGSIAHDLNNLLTAVLGHISYLRVTSEGEIDDSLRSAEDGAKKASQLSKQILDFARLADEREQVDDTDLTDVCELTRASIPLLSPNLPEGISISLKCPDNPLFVDAKDSQLTQILLNLIVNARDAMPRGGKISIDINSIELSSPGVLHGFNLGKGSYARIIVSDTGDGISDEVRARMFEPFFTTKKGTGTGLGLATVFFLVKTLKGAIDVKSAKGQGSSFSVAIPLSSNSGNKSKIEVKEKEPVKAVGVSGSEGVRKILVVDDEEPVRMVLEKSLELIGITPLSAENGKRALDIFKQDFSEIDLVIMDMIMPEMAGDELFYELKKVYPNVRVLISSGYSSDQKTRQLIKDGALGLIQKPFSVEELIDKVKQLII